ncbi:hypothetical protein J6590_032435 [Homalodisca vitripennis]|nr:hypothetical protein J6590_032435 [Homalodisca vitripennis]
MAGCSQTLRDSEIDLVISSDCDDSSECSDPRYIEDVVRSDHSGSGGEPDNDLHQVTAQQPRATGSQLSVCPLPVAGDSPRSTFEEYEETDRRPTIETLKLTDEGDDDLPDNIEQLFDIKLDRKKFQQMVREEYSGKVSIFSRFS